MALAADEAAPALAVVLAAAAAGLRNEDSKEFSGIRLVAVAVGRIDVYMIYIHICRKTTIADNDCKIYTNKYIHEHPTREYNTYMQEHIEKGEKRKSDT